MKVDSVSFEPRISSGALVLVSCGFPGLSPECPSRCEPQPERKPDRHSLGRLFTRFLSALSQGQGDKGHACATHGERGAGNPGSENSATEPPEARSEINDWGPQVTGKWKRQVAPNGIPKFSFFFLFLCFFPFCLEEQFAMFKLPRNRCCTVCGADCTSHDKTRIFRGAPR